MANSSTSKTKKSTTTKSNSNVKKATITKKTVNSSNKKVENNAEKETNIILTVIGIIVLVIVAIIIFRLTYAFFTANVVDENPSNIDADVISADLLVRYVDNNQILESKIKPGDTITKEFRVVNEGNDTGYYTIILENLENTFSVVCPTETEPNNGELVFKLYKYALDLDGNKTETTTLLSTGTLPCVTPASNENYKFELLSQDGVLNNQTNYYKLDIEYKNFLDIDQSNNMDNGRLIAKINIVESENEKRVAN